MSIMHVLERKNFKLVVTEFIQTQTQTQTKCCVKHEKDFEFSRKNVHC